MEQESPSKLSRSTSLPSRPPPAIATDPSPSLTRPPLTPMPTPTPPIAAEPPSSITRPYRLSSSKGFAPSAPKPSALLQRRVNAIQGLWEVKASHLKGDPSPPPPPPPPPPPTPPAPAAGSNPSSAYEVLQISPSASQQEIKTAYWRLARQHHPDKVPPDRKEASSILFLQIHSAYGALKDPEARARYDLQMSLQASHGSPPDLGTPRVYTPSPSVFTPRSQLYTPKGFMATPYSYTPRSQIYTPRSATVSDASSNVVTPRTPFSGGRSWETDQCW